MTFTARDLKAAPAPDPEAVKGAAEQLDIARRALLKAAHHLDASPTRLLHVDALGLKDRAANLLVSLTEWGSE